MSDIQEASTTPPGVTVATYLSAGEAATLRERAEAEDRTVASILRRAFRSYIQNDERPGGNQGESQNTGGRAGRDSA